MDLARDPRALLGDGAAELGREDRAADADDEHDVGEQAQEVALRHVPHRDDRLEEKSSDANSVSVEPSASHRSRSSPSRR